MRFIVFTLLVSSAAYAEGDRFLVLPTQELGGVGLRARHVAQMVHLSLKERSIDVAELLPPETLLTGELGPVCAQSVKACVLEAARGKPGERPATKVIWSQLSDVSAGGATSYRLQLQLWNVPAQTTNELELESGDINALADWAQVEALRFANIEVQGALVVSGLPAGAEIVVDGVVVDRAPVARPLKVSAGRHLVVIRYNGKQTPESAATVNRDQTTELRFCVDADVVNDCNGSTAPPPPGLSPVLIGGGVAVGLGAVGLIVGGVSLGASNAAFEQYQALGEKAQRDSYKSYAGVAAAGLVAGSALVVGGGALSAASLMLE